MSGETLRDYQHAARLFVDNLYRLSPKFSFLFHVYFDINPAAMGMTGKVSKNNEMEVGMLAKTASLPKYTVKNKVYNSYNRKNVIQESVQYDPITITLHDDSADVVRGFWGDYYSYYYRDGDQSDATYGHPHKYLPSQNLNWGFTPKSEIPYLNSIRIYSLHQTYFSGYTLFNPMITSFKHGDHTQGQSETMQHEMTVAYEAVHYLTGSVANGSVTGFDQIHYDNTPSPLASSSGVMNAMAMDTNLTGMMGGYTNLSQFAAPMMGGFNNFNQLATNPMGIVNNLANNVVNQDAYAATSQIGQAITHSIPQMGQAIRGGQNFRSPIFAPTAASIATNLFASAASTVVRSLVTSAIVNINNQNNIRRY